MRYEIACENCMEEPQTAIRAVLQRLLLLLQLLLL
jgi:hypothetical protein